MSLTNIASGIAAYYPLNQASGFDRGPFGEDVTPVGVIPAVASVIGSGAQMERSNGEYFYGSSSGVLDFGDEDFTFAGWFRLDSKVASAAYALFSKTGVASPPDRGQYQLQYLQATDRFRWIVCHTGTTCVIVNADNFGSPTTGQWHFIVVKHDSVNNEISIQVDNGTPNTLAHSLGVFQGVARFRIGAHGNTALDESDAITFIDGSVDELAAWNRILTSDEITSLYNGGSGVDLDPILNPPAPPGPVIGSGTELTEISDGNPYIEVSGLPSFSDEIRWPFGSGVNVDGNVGFSTNLDARLSDLQAQFGFNQTPHRFTMTWVPVCYEFDPDILPDIGSEVDFNIATFRVKGRVVHTDMQKSTGGLKTNVTVEDFRLDLNRVIVDTYGLYDTHQSPAVNLVDVHHWFLTTQGGTDNPRALRMLREHGATYQQIYDAVGSINAQIQSQIPSPSVFAENVGDASRFRFSFRTTPLLDALVKIFSDASFDLYWRVGQDKLQHINRREQVNISLSQVPFAETSSNPETVQLKFGKDEPERPTAIQVVGDRMEGVVGTGPLSASNGGVYGSVANLTIGTGYSFKPAWEGATVFYFGEDGEIQEDQPTEDELAASLKGIEFWTQKKAGNIGQHIDSRIVDRAIDPISGRQVPIVSPVSASGIGLIQNRGQEGRSWIIEWYNRVRNFAQNHYTRTYFLDSGTLKDDLSKFDVVDAAWCGLENQSQGGFNTGYKIQDTFKHLAPFWEETENKLRAWAVIDKSDAQGGSKAPLWGADGKGVPTQFDQWTETNTRVFVPITVIKWDRSSSKFNADFLLRPQQSPEGLMIQFPNTMWRTFETDEDVVRLPKIRYLRNKFEAETPNDATIDPGHIGRTYQEFTSGINIPVRVLERYGVNKPSSWTAGFGLDNVNVKRVKTEVLQRDELAPWNFEPHDDKNSTTLMDEEGQAVADGRVVNRSEATFIEATKHGLPQITFDEYADDDGTVDHGISNLSLTKNVSSYWQTRYSAKTHFPQPVKAKPVPNEVIEDFRFALHRINERFNRPPTPPPITPPPIFDPKTEDESSTFLTKPSKESFKVPVLITELINTVNSAGNSDVAYVGEDESNTLWPVTMRTGIRNSLSPTSKLGLNQYAFAIDGFLQIGMQATYNYEDQDDGSFVHYFTGGVQLREARMAAMLESPKTLDGEFRADVEIESDTLQVQIPNSNPPEFRTVNLQPITLNNVLFSDQQNVDQTLRAGDKVLISGAGQENGNVVKPKFNGTEYTIDMSDEPQKDKILILTSGRAGAGVLFGTITEKPDLTTGRGAKLQTISQLGGTSFEDGKIINVSEGNPGTQYFVDIVGVEYNQVAVGDPCIVTQEAEQDNQDTDEPRVIRLLTFINKPLFTATDAFGGAVT